MTIEVVSIDDEPLENTGVGKEQTFVQEDLSVDQQQYFIWKKNSPILYDHLQTTSLVWPSLTVQFLPDKEVNPTFDRYRLLTGTFTSQQTSEYLNLSDVKVKTKFDISPDHYDIDKQEIIDNSNSQFRTSVLQKILHQGEVNKARYMPQNPDLIATINGEGSVSIFDRTKYPSQPLTSFKNDISLKHHKLDGFGLSWNMNKEGELVTGASDGLICLYDITKWSGNNDLEPQVFVAHDNGVNDVKFCYENDSVFGSVGEDHFLKVWDKRKTEPLFKVQLESPLNSIAPNPLNQFILSVGDNKGNIKTFDLRNTSEPLFKSSSHHDLSISCLEWNYENGSILASGSEDKTVKIWDMAKHDEKDNGLIFVHAGHLFGVNDISWNPNDDKMIASVSDDNTLHVWKPAL